MRETKSDSSGSTQWKDRHGVIYTRDEIEWYDVDTMGAGESQQYTGFVVKGTPNFIPVTEVGGSADSKKEAGAQRDTQSNIERVDSDLNIGSATPPAPGPSVGEQTGDGIEAIAKETLRALRYSDDLKDHEKYCEPGNLNAIRNALLLAIRWFAIDDAAVGELVSKMRDFHHAQYTAKNYQECASIIRSVFAKRIASQSSDNKHQR